VPGLRAVTGEYKQIETQYTNVFEITKSNMEVERTVSMQFLGYAALKTEGGQTQFDNTAGQRFASRVSA
jgi:hypothetical protein